MSEFGELLKELRKEHRISQRKLADMVGIDFTYISKIESGTMVPPAEDKIIKIAEIFNVDSDKLLIAANKIPADFQKVITEIEDVPVFLRSASKFSQTQWKEIKRIIDETKDNEE
ncbi:helix-turn-helix domain-containing protein [Paenibacillus camerounensis]|uniref:helix-turn-helix domain-containing protein n=1 Tax=Paenibacillus camerounensis TaxID=1243663 RepID=UPI0005A694E6|nr:helix-turn-helix transcriptional regulator [Paenibacillus camerounensis]